MKWTIDNLGLKSRKMMHRLVHQNYFSDFINSSKIPVHRIFFHFTTSQKNWKLARTLWNVRSIIFLRPQTFFKGMANYSEVIHGVEFLLEIVGHVYRPDKDLIDWAALREAPRKMAAKSESANFLRSS